MRWHRMAKVDTATGKLVAQLDVSAETLPDAFAQMRAHTGASNSNELRFLGYVAAPNNPQWFACECENAHHSTHRTRPDVTIHNYGARFQVLHTVRTVRGTFHVCAMCVEHMAPYLTSEPA